MQPGWAKRQCEKSEENIREWPEWMRREAGITLSETNQERESVPRKPTFGFNLPPLPKKAYEILRKFQGEKDAKTGKWEIPQIEVITAALLNLEDTMDENANPTWGKSLWEEAKRLCGR